MAYHPHPTLLPPSLLPPSILSLFNAPPPPPGDAAAAAPPGSLRAAIHLLYAFADAALGAATDALSPVAPNVATLSTLRPPSWDPFLAALAAAHAAVIAVAVATRDRRRHLGAQLGLLLYAGALVATAPTANRLGSAHWPRFAARDYFDDAGAFVCVVGCGVPLVVAVVAVGRLVLAAGEEGARAAARKRGRKRD